MKQSPLLLKSFFTLTLLFTGTLGAGAALTAWRTNANLTAQYEARGRVIADSIAYCSAELLLFRDVSTVQAMMDQFQAIEGASYIFVVDAHGEIISHTFTPGIPDEVRQLKDPGPAAHKSLIQIDGLGEFIDVSSPILAGKVGQVHVGMDRGAIRSAIWSAISVQALLLGAILLVGLGIAFYLVQRIVEPLDRLTEYANKMAARDFSADQTTLMDTDLAPITQRSDEIGQLAKAFGHMLLEVSAREKLLREGRDKLEMRVQERTAAAQMQAIELARSNQELEQFAYVASHDLQEPLRMIASYLDLLTNRYHGNIDEKADRWIGFAIDGALRMKRLINDLLEYSRVARKGKAFEPTDCKIVVENALANLRQAIQESNAIVHLGSLPTVPADSTQLMQLFQNLIGNAIKYRSVRTPEIHISAERQDDHWLFAVRDNGIGIDPQFSERIFVIFQRLHTREEYPGTGIGLALCKKIVERHEGKIWIESQPGQGSTFFFTLPAIRNQGGEAGG